MGFDIKNIKKNEMLNYLGKSKYIVLSKIKDVPMKDGSKKDIHTATDENEVFAIDSEMFKYLAQFNTKDKDRKFKVRQIEEVDYSELE